MNRNEMRASWIGRTAVAMAAVAATVLGVTLQAAPAAAYTLTGCKWGNGPTITWSNGVTGVYSTTAQYAATSWANSTDINGMTPSGGNLSTGLTISGMNGYAGWTDWVCGGGGFTISAHATLNHTYTGSYSTNAKIAVWTHEFGHAVGLNHAASNFYIMYTCPKCAYDAHGVFTPQSDDKNGANHLY